LVHIKKLEVYGFKSFGFRNTTLNFEKGLVAITGPNGSGKSNILDAIMFAIGENSPKALRVDKFQSLFHDSHSASTRLIRTSLNFDNSDRGMPVDSDSVTITREMEGQTGESQYYLNRKKVTKATLMELLEIVLGNSNKLNIIQQGMITRISELNSEDRRKIIEDIIGLSYFDEKKSEALKQLDESDRRLEIAMARIDEMKKRIDELEEERNQQLRYKQLLLDLERFKAVKVSNDIRATRNSMQAKTEVLKSHTERSADLAKQIEKIDRELEKQESEKINLMKEAGIAGPVKAEISTRIADMVYQSERKRAIIKETEQRLLNIEKRIISIEEEKENGNQKLENLRLEIHRSKADIDDRSRMLEVLRSESAAIGSQIDKLTASAGTYAFIRTKLEVRLKRLTEMKRLLCVLIAKIEEQSRSISESIITLHSQISSLEKVIKTNKDLHNDLSNRLDTENSKLHCIVGLVENLKIFKANLEANLNTSTNLLSAADTFTMRYEVKASTAKNVMNEDVAIVEFMKNSSHFGIKGLVHDLIEWDRDYERSVLAAGSEWMKAFVVENVQSMISIAEHAKKINLPRLKVIPLDVVHNVKRFQTPEDNPNIVGNLANFVYSDYEELSDFLFGNTVLVKTPTDAYLLAKDGYRAVSVEGELFEPIGTSMSADFGSTISDLTQVLLVSNSIDMLRNLLSRLRQLITEKDSNLKEVTSKIECAGSERNELEKKISNFVSQISNQKTVADQDDKHLEQLYLESVTTRSRYDSLNIDLMKQRRRLSLLESTMSRVYDTMKSVTHTSMERELGRMNAKKAEIVHSMDTIDLYSQNVLRSCQSMKNEVGIGLDRLSNLGAEKCDLEAEVKEETVNLGELKTSLASIEDQLRIQRDREQQLIDSARTSVDKLQVYEQEMRTLKENERTLSKEQNSLEKDIALLGKDISYLDDQESSLVAILTSSGNKDLLEPFDVDALIGELTAELETLKPRLNLRAEEVYAEVIGGYRGMSDKKNLLERERHSIILFIEEIVTEKKTLFREAFEKVNNNLKETFSDVTGGTARLEIENIEDEFSGGLTLMVQFPGKPARESTALSGGEKTMAAIIFLLALQSLRPSPFYLMDEVDAHLDAQNTEKLSNVLSKRSKDNQMLMVTLKDVTVAKANMIYGVYSQDGISRVIRYSDSNRIPLEEIKSSASTI
jgi:chromosome segregation protein